MTKTATKEPEFKAPPPPPPTKPQPEQRELPLEGYSLGDEHPVLKTLQLALGVSGTGVYDEATRRAVQNLQFNNGMDTNGVATPAVFAKLNIAWEK